MAARRSPNRTSDRGGRRARLTEWADAHDLSLIFFDPPVYFDHAIVGIVEGFNQEPAVLYDEEQVIAAMVADGMDEDGAREYFEFNTRGAYLGQETPRFVIMRVDQDDQEDRVA